MSNNDSFKCFLDEFEKKKVESYPNKVGNNPLVSICVQTYNHENSIAQCLAGILNQKVDFDFEVLLGEDASTDKTREICLDYAKAYPDKIKLFLHHRENNIKVHGNPTGRFNFFYNLYSSNGKYIAFCEGDDYWIDPLKLQKQVDYLEKHKKYVVSWTNYKTLDGKDFIENEFEITETHKKINFDSIFRPYCTLTLTVLFLKSSLNLSELQKFKYFKDNTLYALLLKNGLGVFINSVTAVYRHHQGGVYSSKSSFFKNYSSYLNIKEIIDFIPEANTVNMKKVLASLGKAAAYDVVKLQKEGVVMNEVQKNFLRAYYKNASFKIKAQIFKRRYLK